MVTFFMNGADDLSAILWGDKERQHTVVVDDMCRRGSGTREGFIGGGRCVASDRMIPMNGASVQGEKARLTAVVAMINYGLASPPSIYNQLNRFTMANTARCCQN